MSINHFRGLQLLPLIAATVMGCGEGSSNQANGPEAADTSHVSAEVEAAVWSFHAADTARNAEAVIDLLSPEFYMFVDGARNDYEGVVTGTRQFMASLDHFSTEWTDLRIIPLGGDYAVASFTFRDSIETKAGELIRNTGPTTLIWERNDGTWRIAYADADHYPVDR